jgi:uncharacterized protein (TIGR03083 family)
MDAISGLDYPLLLADFQGEFLASIPDADPAARIPGCGDWTVRELVEHLAIVHHWAAANARAEKAEPLGEGPFDLAAHYAACATELRETLAALAPQAQGRILAHPEPTAPGPASFWRRRQVHETLIHGHDLRAAIAGKAAQGLIRAVPEVWADTVDEVVGVFYPRQVGMGRLEPLEVALRLVATDLADPVEWVLGDSESTAGTVSGTAEGLALLLWGRASADEAGVHISGDTDQVEEILNRPIVP